MNQDEKYIYLAQDLEKNESELRKMVETEAKKNGYNSPIVYHGSKSKFHTFHKEEELHGGLWGDGYYFSSNMSHAREFGFNILKVYLKRGNVYAKNQNDAIYDALDLQSTDFDSFEITNSKFGGSVKFPKIYEGFTEYVVRNPNQIKSADLVTYDDNGDIIPLSKRFNDKVKDIRESVNPIISLEEVNSILHDIKRTTGQLPTQPKLPSNPTLNQGLKRNANNQSKIAGKYNQDITSTNNPVSKDAQKKSSVEGQQQTKFANASNGQTFIRSERDFENTINKAGQRSLNLSIGQKKKINSANGSGTVEKLGNGTVKITFDKPAVKKLGERKRTSFKDWLARNKVVEERGVDVIDIFSNIKGKSPQGVIDYIYERGGRKLGESGNFGLALKGSVGENVIKLTFDDGGYDRYFKLSQKNITNSLYPRYTKRLVWDYDGVNVQLYAMELLDVDPKRNARFIEDLFENDDDSNLYHKAFDIFGVYLIDHSVEDTMTRYKIKPKHTDLVARLKEWYINLKTIIGEGFGNLDAHRGNFGFRKNGELVIFDPLADEKDFQ